MFSYLFGYSEPELEQDLEPIIQPSYKELKQRDLVMRQIRYSKLKLNKTYNIDQKYTPIGYNSYYRVVGLRKVR